MYDYLVVGAGLYETVFAHETLKKGKRVLVIDERPNITENIYTEEIKEINVHKYGAHIFRANNKQIWEYVNQFVEFSRFTNSPVTNYNGELYSLPFNVCIFNKTQGVMKSEGAEAKTEKQKKRVGIKEPRNLEEQAISLIGTDIYERLVKGYTEKQWGRPCSELPAFIIKRLPVKFTFDNNYFNALFQGTPIGGYTKVVTNILEDVEVKLCTDYLESRETYEKIMMKVIYTDPVDAYYKFQLGTLEYCSIRSKTEILNKPNFQGNVVANYTDTGTPWTRIIEHKQFGMGTQPKTVISRGYGSEWGRGDEPCYPVNNKKSEALYAEYRKLADQEKRVLIDGRLNEYRYYDMGAVIYPTLDMCARELSVN